MALPDALVARLRAEIVTGVRGPGDALSEEIIAREHDVSRETVRAGLQELVRLGMVERAPYCAAVVRRPSVQDLVDLIDVRVGLEPILVARFVQRATDDELEAFARAQQRLDLAVTKGDPAAIERGRQGFYEALNRGAGSWVMSATVERETARLAVVRTQLLGWGFELERMRAGSEHRRSIAPLMRRRDPVGSMRACTRHLLEDGALTMRRLRLDAA